MDGWVCSVVGCVCARKEELAFGDGGASESGGVSACGKERVVLNSLGAKGVGLCGCGGRRRGWWAWEDIY